MRGIICTILLDQFEDQGSNKRGVVPGGTRGAKAPPDFGMSVNPNKGGQIIPIK